MGRGNRFAAVLVAIAVLGLAGCASLQEKRAKEPASGKNTPDSQASRASSPAARLEPRQPVKSRHISREVENASDIEKITIEDIIRVAEPNTQTLYDDSRYDFPITMNSRVEGWIDYFTGRGRRHMERYLGRSTRYVPMMRKILREEGVPEDLIYLALIESGFNVRARSWAHAVGPWQFIKATGQRYGLRVDTWIDERKDPERATRAAARYLKDLYLMFESWYLAAAAYNAGEYKILRAIEALKTNNFWRIAETRHIRRETKDYVPKLIAAAIIGKNAKRYGFHDVAYEEPFNHDTVTVDFAVHLRDVAELIDESLETLQDLNPELNRSIVPADKGPYTLRVPSGRQVVLERSLASLRHTFPKLDQPLVHHVRRGESLYSISRRYNISRHQLAQLNNLSPRAGLRIGQRLVVPGLVAAAAGRPNTRTVAAEVRREKFRPRSKDYYANRSSGVHRVLRGESLWQIAEKYNVTIQDIFRWNGLTRSRIYPGMQLKIRPEQGDVAKSGKEYVVHVVRNGDSLWSISKAYDVSVREIKQWNKMRHSRIYPGKRLRIRPSTPPST